MLKTNAMRLLAVALILPLAACADTGEEEMEMETDTVATTAPTEEAAPISLQAQNESGITGEIESETRGDSIFLTVRMDGASGTDYASHVHSGPCSAADAPVAAQVSLQWGAAGAAGATTGEAEAGERPSGGMDEPATTAGQETNVRVGVAKADLTDPQGEYSLRFHGEGGEVVACADLPSRLTAATTPTEGGTGEEGARNR